LKQADRVLRSIAQFYGPSGLYYFPILGPRGLWDA